MTFCIEFGDRALGHSSHYIRSGFLPHVVNFTSDLLYSQGHQSTVHLLTAAGIPSESPMLQIVYRIIHHANTFILVEERCWTGGFG